MDYLQLIVIAIGFFSFICFVKTEIDFWHKFRMNEIRQKFVIKDYNSRRVNKFKMNNAFVILGVL